VLREGDLYDDKDLAFVPFTPGCFLNVKGIAEKLRQDLSLLQYPVNLLFSGSYKIDPAAIFYMVTGLHGILFL
jgi:hypothetical protein